MNVDTNEIGCLDRGAVPRASTLRATQLGGSLHRYVMNQTDMAVSTWRSVLNKLREFDRSEWPIVAHSLQNHYLQMNCNPQSIDIADFTRFVLPVVRLVLRKLMDRRIYITPTGISILPKTVIEFPHHYQWSQWLAVEDYRVENLADDIVREIEYRFGRKIELYTIVDISSFYKGQMIKVQSGIRGYQYEDIRTTSQGPGIGSRLPYPTW